MSAPNHLLLVDGSNLMNRAFYTMARRQLAGLPNAVGRMLAGAVRRWEATHLVVALDSPEPCFRRELIPELKADREGREGPGTAEMTNALRPALLAWGVATREAPAMEADDVMASMAAKAVAIGCPVSILSKDSDLLQLVDDAARVRVLWPDGAADGETSLDEAGAAGYLEAHKEFQAAFPPARMLDLRVLAGGKDNLPRVGWTDAEREGKKQPFGFTTRRAAQLLAAGATLESLYAEHEHLLNDREREWLGLRRAEAFARRAVLALRADLVPIGNGPATTVHTIRFGAAPPADLVAAAAPAAAESKGARKVKCHDCPTMIPFDPVYNPDRCPRCAMRAGREKPHLMEV